MGEQRESEERESDIFSSVGTPSTMASPFLESLRPLALDDNEKEKSQEKPIGKRSSYPKKRNSSPIIRKERLPASVPMLESGFLSRVMADLETEKTETSSSKQKRRSKKLKDLLNESPVNKDGKQS